MEYLLFLNRFELDKDKLKSKIKSLDISAAFDDDNGRLFVNSKLDPGMFLQFHEVSKLSIIFSYWKKFNFKSLKEICLKLCEIKNINNYIIETKFHDKVPISAKSLYKHINPYLKHENILVDEENGDIIYLEFKKIDGNLSYRVNYSKREYWKKLNSVDVDLNKFAAVIENPTLISEVSDFLRLCWVFKIPLYIVTKDKTNFEKVLKKAKEETKGIEYYNFKLNISDKLPSGFLLVGFSKHSSKNERDMKEVILGEKKIALVFGDDKFGLTQETRDKLDHSFRLTPETKKPLRASHALSYVLGFYTAYKI